MYSCRLGRLAGIRPTESEWKVPRSNLLAAAIGNHTPPCWVPPVSPYNPAKQGRLCGGRTDHSGVPSLPRTGGITAAQGRPCRVPAGERKQTSGFSISRGPHL